MKSSSHHWWLLAVHIVRQAVVDLSSVDVLTALDALGWFLDGGAAEMLAEIDMTPNGNLLEKAVRNGKEKNENSRCFAG